MDVSQRGAVVILEVILLNLSTFRVLFQLSGGISGSVVSLRENICACVCVLAFVRQGVDWQTPQNPLIEFLLVCHSSFIGVFWHS